MSKLVRSFASTAELPTCDDGTVASVGGVLYVRLAGAWVELASPAAAREQVTGAVALTNTSDVLAEITTIGASYTLTLPAATDGQRVYIADRTGTAGTSSYFVRVAPNGAETIRIPNVGTCSGLYLCADSAAFTLVGVAGVGWEVVGGTGYAVDPRLVSGLYLWLDARRGITLASNRIVSGWADQSGNGRDFSQAVAGSRPALSRLPGSSALPAVYANGGQRMATANQSIASGALTAVALLAAPAPAGDGTTRALLGWNYAQLTGVAFGLSVGTTTLDFVQYDSFLFGDGYGIGRAPRAIGYWGTASGAIPAVRGTGAHTLAARVSAGAAAIEADGVSLVSRLATAGAVPNITNQPLYLFEPTAAGTEYFTGWLSSLLVFDAAISDANLALLQADLLRQAGR